MRQPKQPLEILQDLFKHIATVKQLAIPAAVAAIKLAGSVPSIIIPVVLGILIAIHHMIDIEESQLGGQSNAFKLN